MSKSFASPAGRWEFADKTLCFKMCMIHVVVRGNEPGASSAVRREGCEPFSTVGADHEFRQIATDDAR